MTDSRQSSRRRFMGTTLGGTAAAATAGGFVPFVAEKSRGFANESPNDRPAIGCVGMGWMGMHDARGLAEFGDIVAVCDVDAKNLDRARHDVRVGAGKADAYRDYRKMLERPDIDVVSIATHDPWHVKIAIEALQAGKHVFCEKPLSLTLEENQLARAAAEKYPRQQFFIGTQQRSDRNLFLRAVNMVHKGLLGDIRQVTVALDGGQLGGSFPVEDVPKSLDWDMWQGQAPSVSYRLHRFHQYRWWYEYSGGKFTDWGAHHVDIAQWALREDARGKGPVSIDGVDARHPVPFKNGYPTLDDWYNTAYEFGVKCRFASGVEMVITSRGENGITFTGTKGSIFVSRKRIAGTPIDEAWDEGRFTDDDARALFKGKPPEEHKQNFFRCIREGGLPVSDVFSHVVAMNTCHLAAIAARLGRTIAWDPATERIVGDEQAASFAARTPRKGFEIPRV